MALEFSKEEFKSKISKGIVFLDFYATWCAPCNSFFPVFEKISQEFSQKASFLKINVDEQRDIAIEYRISSIPTVLCLKDGIVSWTHTGTMQEATFREKVKEFFN